MRVRHDIKKLKMSIIDFQVKHQLSRFKQMATYPVLIIYTGPASPETSALALPILVHLLRTNIQSFYANNQGKTSFPPSAARTKVMKMHPFGCSLYLQRIIHILIHVTNCSSDEVCQLKMGDFQAGERGLDTHSGPEPEIHFS